MKMTEIRFTLGYTYNLGDYSNVRPEITLTAEVDGDASNALVDLYQTALGHCHRVIDDALEAEGRPAHFSEEQRFVAYAAHDEKLYAIVPQETSKHFQELFPEWYRTLGHQGKKGFRADHLWSLLEEQHDSEEYRIFDARKDTLPRVEKVFECKVGNMLFIGRGRSLDVMPQYLSVCADPKIHTSHVRNWETFEADMRRKAKSLGLTLFNISDDDWQAEEEVIAFRTAYEERMNKEQPPVEEEDEIPFDEDEDDEDDEDDE